MARRVQFGTTWWGKQWIDALTHLDYENRLPRGRTYYNTGRIDDMQFNPAKLRVEAIAHGSAYSPYEVAIDLKPLPSEDVTRLVDAVAERPALLAKLLEGELDPEVGEIASGARHQPLPAVVEGVPHVLLVSRRCGSLQAYCGCLLRNGEDDRRGPDVGLPLQGR